MQSISNGQHLLRKIWGCTFRGLIILSILGSGMRDASPQVDLCNPIKAKYRDQRPTQSGGGAPRLSPSGPRRHTAQDNRDPWTRLEANLASRTGDESESWRKRPNLSGTTNPCLTAFPITDPNPVFNHRDLARSAHTDLHARTRNSKFSQILIAPNLAHAKCRIRDSDVTAQPLRMRGQSDSFHGVSAGNSHSQRGEHPSPSIGSIT